MQITVDWILFSLFDPKNPALLYPLQKYVRQEKGFFLN
jgi:hypothetical protein